MALSILFATALSAAPNPAALWPAQPPEAKKSTPQSVEADIKDTIAAIESLPSELRPALGFQQAYNFTAVRGAINDWLPKMRTFAANTAVDPITTGVREAARAWVARGEMVEIGKTLDKYYAQNVRYPATFAEIAQTLPAELRIDPWGDEWAYRPHAPPGFPGQSRQRYTLGPKRFPDLGTIRDATEQRKPLVLPAWKIALRTVGANRALEFQQNGAVAGLITAGAKLDAFTLLYVGDHWALMSATDQLFSVTF